MSKALAQPRFDLATRAASARPTTYRDADRSIEALAATETPVRTTLYDYQLRQWIDCEEVFAILDMTDEEVQAFVGCPILDSHSTWSTLDIVGVVTEARRENGNRDLVIRFSIDESEPVIGSKVKSGTIRKVSLGAMRKRDGATYTQRDEQIPLHRTPIIPAKLSLGERLNRQVRGHDPHRVRAGRRGSEGVIRKDKVRSFAFRASLLRVATDCSGSWTMPAALAVLALSTGCASDPRGPLSQWIPPSLLTCAERPDPATPTRHSDVARWIVEADGAGEDCRRKLRAVWGIVEEEAAAAEGTARTPS